MDDLIRRSDVFELLDNWDSEMIIRDSFYCDVEDIPTAQQWIPCSERLPELGVEVLVTWTNGVDIAYWDIGPSGRYWDFGEFWLKEWEGEVHGKDYYSQAERKASRERWWLRLDF